jgi:FkbM family methyltransferase
MISYAQNFEDVMLDRVFKTKTNGFYIDVGAADPTNLSVTKWFYDNGWRGINIEPVSEFFDLLERDRPRDINLNCGAGSANGEMRFHEYPVKEWSTFDLQTQAPAKGPDETIREIVAAVKTLNDIIEENAAEQPIDFLKIDVEGWEEQVLRGIDFGKHRPTVVLIEAIDRDTGEQISAASEKLLAEAGYLFVYFDGINKFFLKKENENLTKHFAAPPNSLDNFKLHSEVELEKALEMQGIENRQLRIDLQARDEQVAILTDEVKKFEALSMTGSARAETMAAAVQKSEELRQGTEQQIQALISVLAERENVLKEREEMIEEFAWYANTKFGRALRPLWRFLKGTARAFDRHGRSNQ